MKNIKLAKEKYLFIARVAIASGLYPLIYLYTSNFTLVNSSTQFFGIFLLYIMLPILIFVGAITLIKFIDKLNPLTSKILTFSNLIIFTTLIIYGAYRVDRKIKVLIAIVVIGVLTLFIDKYLNKIIKFQFILAFVGFFFFVPKLYNYLNYDYSWIKQNDTIEKVKFKNTPNIYFIQPDGYIGFSEIGRGYYNKDNSNFKEYLLDNEFKIYPDFRSNYSSTLSSNSSMFTMKHHYYNHLSNSYSELYNTRKIITGNNAVLSILKSNNYYTSLIIENSYLLVNRPKLAFDYCNIDYNELSLVSNGFEIKKDVTKDLEIALKRKTDTPHFYFIEKISPGHIATTKANSQGKEEERNAYLQKIDEANIWLKETITLIKKYDTNSLILIAADHGGFVGLNYTAQVRERQEDNFIINSMFSTLLAINWPSEKAEIYDAELKTSVNIFRILFSYLGEDKSLLNSLESDKSFLYINKNNPEGIYEIINENNEKVFEALN